MKVRRWGPGEAECGASAEGWRERPALALFPDWICFPTRGACLRSATCRSSSSTLRLLENARRTRSSLPNAAKIVRMRTLVFSELGERAPAQAASGCYVRPLSVAGKVGFLRRSRVPSRQHGSPRLKRLGSLRLMTGVCGYQRTSGHVAITPYSVPVRPRGHADE